MSHNNASERPFDGKAVDPGQPETSKHLFNEVMSAWPPPATESEAGKFNPNKAPIERPDVANGMFDENAPISHFEKVDDGVYRSGRPIGMEGVKQGVEKAWGDQEFDPAHAAKTSIIELRGPAPGKYYQANEDEVKTETQNSEELGINHIRFPIKSHDHQDPEFIQSIVDYMDQQKADGNRVLVHCFHGTDRTGLVTAAYKLNHDPQLQELVKDNPQEAFKQGLKYMTDNGFSPQLYPELTQSLQAYVNWKSQQLNGHASQDNTSTNNKVAAQFIDVPSLWQKAA